MKILFATFIIAYFLQETKSSIHNKVQEFITWKGDCAHIPEGDYHRIFTRQCRGERVHNDILKNYCMKCICLLDHQIRMEFMASHAYLYLANHFQRHDVALHGFSKTFMNMALEEREHATKLMAYMNKRGMPFKFHEIPKPDLLNKTETCYEDTCDNTNCDVTLDAMTIALNLERMVNCHLIYIRGVATSAGNDDFALADFIEKEYLEEQVQSIKEFGDHITNLKNSCKPSRGIRDILYNKKLLNALKSS